MPGFPIIPAPPPPGRGGQLGVGVPLPPPACPPSTGGGCTPAIRPSILDSSGCCIYVFSLSCLSGVPAYWWIEYEIADEDLAPDFTFATTQLPAADFDGDVLPDYYAPDYAAASQPAPDGAPDPDVTDWGEMAFLEIVTLASGFSSLIVHAVYATATGATTELTYDMSEFVGCPARPFSAGLTWSGEVGNTAGYPSPISSEMGGAYSSRVYTTLYDFESNPYPCAGDPGAALDVVFANIIAGTVSYPVEGCEDGCCFDFAPPTPISTCDPTAPVLAGGNVGSSAVLGGTIPLTQDTADPTLWWVDAADIGLKDGDGNFITGVAQLTVQSNVGIATWWYVIHTSCY